MRIVRKIATSVGAVDGYSWTDRSIEDHDFIHGKAGFPGSIVSHQSMNSRGQEFQAQIVQRAHPGRSQIRSPNRDRGKTVRVVFSVNRESSFRLSELP
jgi:hypothetical protein